MRGAVAALIVGVYHTSRSVRLRSTSPPQMCLGTFSPNNSSPPGPGTLQKQFKLQCRKTCVIGPVQRVRQMSSLSERCATVADSLEGQLVRVRRDPKRILQLRQLPSFSSVTQPEHLPATRDIFFPIQHRNTFTSTGISHERAPWISPMLVSRQMFFQRGCAQAIPWYFRSLQTPEFDYNAHLISLFTAMRMPARRYCIVQRGSRCCP